MGAFVETLHDELCCVMGRTESTEAFTQLGVVELLVAPLHRSVVEQRREMPCDDGRGSVGSNEFGHTPQ